MGILELKPWSCESFWLVTAIYSQDATLPLLWIALWPSFQQGSAPRNRLQTGTQSCHSCDFPASAMAQSMKVLASHIAAATQTPADLPPCWAVHVRKETNHVDPCHPHETRMQLLAPDFGLDQPQLSLPFGGKSVDDSLPRPVIQPSKYII